MLSRRLRPLAIAAASLGVCAVLAVGDGSGDALADQPTIDVTAAAVQTYYQGGVPHTNVAGQPLGEYEPGSSIFPRGIYWPMPCTVPYGFSWLPYGGSPDFDGNNASDWDGSYQVIVTLAGLLADEERSVVRNTRRTQTSIIDLALPTSTELTYRVYANPYEHANAPLVYENTINLACPITDVDDPNAVSAIADAGFNRAISTWATNPRLLIELKERAVNAGDVSFVIDARQGPCFDEFSEQLFLPPADGGQGYGTHPDIYGWQIEDEPLLRTALTPVGAPCSSGAGCDVASLAATISRLDAKVSLYGDQTDQVLFSVEGAPQWFPTECDPASWDQAVDTGDAGDHDNYIRHSAPLTTLKPIVDSVAKQTLALGESKPSWFTAQAFDGSGFVFPSPSENRASVYAAIVHGATGVWYFTLDGSTARSAGLVGVAPDVPPSYPESAAFGGRSANAATIAAAESLWASIDNINHEIEDLTPVLLSPTSVFPYQVRVSSRPNTWSPLRTMLKYVDGEHYLIAVNIDGTANDVEFDFGHDVLSGAVLFENRALAAGQFVDHFERFDVHVYRLRFEDSDGDGVDNVADNCLLAPNADQADADRDRLGLACDPDDTKPDTDRDGCDNERELGTDPSEGGMRNPNVFWDFYDVPTGPNATRDRAVAGTDLFALLQRFAQDDAIGTAGVNRFSDPLSAVTGSAYHPAFDRSRAPTGEWWRSRAPDGFINGMDLFALLGQFGHHC